MTVSIVIPANGEKIETIDECINSIYSQMGKDDSITLVSSEYNVQNVFNLMQKYPLLETITSSQKLTPSKARNRGAANAKNDWLLFIDCDCKLENNYFSNLQKILEKVDASFIGCVGSLKPQSVNSDWSKFEGLDHDSSIQKYIFEENNTKFIKIGVGANMLVKRSTFRDYGGFDEQMESAEDREFGAKLFSRGNSLQYKMEILVYHKFDVSLPSIIKRHWWHAKGNGMLYVKYPLIFRNPIKNRLHSMKQLLFGDKGKKPDRLSFLYTVTVSLTYFICFTFHYYKSRLGW